MIGKSMGSKGKWLLTTVLLFLFVLPQLIPAFYTYLLSAAMIRALFATSLNLLLGYGGIVSLGHAACFGVGAYTVVLLTVKCGLPLGLAMIAGPILAGVVSLVIGYLSLRRAPIYFSLLTLAFNLIIYLLAIKWSSLTGGDNGVSGISLPSYFSTTTGFYYFALILVLVCFALMWMIINSFFGKVVQAIRENKQRAEFVGFNVRRFELTLFVIGGLFGGFAGVLYALFTKGAYPAYADAMESLEALLMCALGGMFSFIGPTVGAFLLVLLSKVISDYLQAWPIAIGAMLILVGTFFRDGIIGTLEGRFKRGNERIG